MADDRGVRRDGPNIIDVDGPLSGDATTDGVQLAQRLANGQCRLIFRHRGAARAELIEIPFVMALKGL